MENGKKVSENLKYWFQIKPLRCIVVTIIEEKKDGTFLVADAEHDNFLYTAKKEQLEEIK